MYNNIEIYAPVLGKWALSCSNRLSDNRKQKFVKEYIEKAVSNSVWHIWWENSQARN